MDSGIFEAASDVGFVGIKNYHSSLVEYTIGLGWFAIVFMDFRKALGKFDKSPENLMIRRDRGKLLVGIELSNFPPDALVQTVTVVDPEESSVVEICYQPVDLVIGEFYVAVAGQENHRIVVQLVIGDLDREVLWLCRQFELFSGGFQEIRNRGRIGIPIPAPAVL